MSPGEGRLLACLYAHSDKLSGRCLWQVYQGKEFLRAVKQTVEAHNWDAFLDRHCEHRHRVSQIDELGMNASQYIAEILGLHQLVASGDPSRTRQTLDSITRISFPVDPIPSDDFQFIVGQVTLDNGPTLPVRLEVVHVQSGFALTGPVG